MSLFTSLLPVVGGLLGMGDDNKPKAPAVPQSVPLSAFKSSLDDPLTSIYAQQALADLGYDTTKTGGDTYYKAIGQYGKEGLYDQRVMANPNDPYYQSLYGGKQLTDDEFQAWKNKYGDNTASAYWKKDETPTKWTIAEGSEPSAYQRLRDNYNAELGAQQAKLLGNMASRGILRSGATADAARQMSEATGTAISNAIEGQRQSALNRLNSLVESERNQQYRGAQVANMAAQQNFNNANTAYGNAQDARTQGINELASVLGGIGNVRFGGRKTTVPSYNPSVLDYGGLDLNGDGRY